MNHLIITYRIKGDETYQVRYDSFIRKLKETGGQLFWNETSSFYALTSSATADELCRALCADTGFECGKDAVVVIDITNKTTASSGTIQNRELLQACIGF